MMSSMTKAILILVLGSLLIACNDGSDNRVDQGWSDSDLISLTVTEAMEVLESGELTSERYVEALITRIEANEPALNAFIYFDADSLRADAVAADAVRASGAPVGPLHGLPIIIKDSFDVAGLPTTAGTPALATNVPGINGAAVQRLFDAGAILVGKANLHELSSGLTTNNAFTGATHNPYDLTRIPGGSSGGNAAALAARFAPFALGEDTGGSGRSPCALTGCVGFRPTTGRYPTQGAVPLSPTMDTPAPMARSVADVALIDSVLAGVAYEPVEPRSVRGLRIGVPRALFYDNLDPTVVAALNRSLEQLTQSGAVLIEADIPLVNNNALLSFNAVAGWETGAAIINYLNLSGSPITIFDILEGIASPDVKYLWDQVASGVGPTEEEYQQAMTYRAEMQQFYQSYFVEHGVEAIIYPTVPLPATPIGQDFFIELNGQQVPATDTIGRNSWITPLIGAPSISIGMGQSPAGLPLGLEVAGPIGADASLLAIAAGIDSVLSPSVRPPPILPEPSH